MGEYHMGELPYGRIFIRETCISSNASRLNASRLTVIGISSKYYASCLKFGASLQKNCASRLKSRLNILDEMHSSKF